MFHRFFIARGFLIRETRLETLPQVFARFYFATNCITTIHGVATLVTVY